MKLNPDCVRDILLDLEDVAQDVSVTYNYNSWEEVKSLPHLQKYSADTIAYHIRQCDLNGMLYHSKIHPQGGFSFRDIAPSAHEFLANIRQDTIWNDVKSVAVKTGSLSLNVLIQIATGLISEVIKNRS